MPKKPDVLCNKPVAVHSCSRRSMQLRNVAIETDTRPLIFRVGAPDRVAVEAAESWAIGVGCTR